MAKICIDAKVAEKMKQAVRDGEINVQDLYDAGSSAARRAVFEKFASPDLAKAINTEFERAMVSEDKAAFTKWAENVFTPAEKKKEVYSNVLDKIKELDDMGVLSPQARDNFMQDLVADRLGINVSPEEVAQISQRAKRLQELYEKPDADGNPSSEYWRERRSMEDYLSGVTPTSKIKLLTHTIGRGAMLLSFKSPLVNIISNTVQGAVQGLERRFAAKEYRGLSSDLAINYVKKVNKIYQESGYDISRMVSMSDGVKNLGEQVVSSEGPGAIRAMSRWYEDVVFKQMMGAPDVAYSSVAFADSANLAATRIALDEGLSGAALKKRADAIFKDATRITPLTKDGEIVRSQGMTDAFYSTFTNDGSLSYLALGIRNLMNRVSGDIRIGDQLMPFVKTPANVVEAGLDAAGIGAFKGFLRLPEAVRMMKQGDTTAMRDVTRLFIRSGLGISLAAALAFILDPDDYISDFDVIGGREKGLTAAKNGVYNSVKIGDKYISLDFLGPLASPFVGIMYARKYGGEGIASTIYQYGRGVATQALKLPGMKEVAQLAQEIRESATKEDPKDVATGLTDDAIGYIRSRTIPAIVNDLAKATDEFDRQTGRDEISKVKASIPGLRQTLPEKVNPITGKKLSSEGFISTLLFGTRVKTAAEGELVKEISKLYDKKAGPTISSVEFASTRVKKMKEQLSPEEFNQMLQVYGEDYERGALRVISTGKYMEATPDEKKDMLNDVRKKTLNRTLKNFGYKKSSDEVS